MSDMEDLDELKLRWKQLGLRVDNIEAGHRQTCLDRIGGTYKRMCIAGAAVLVPGLYALGRLCMAPVAASVLWCVVMLTAVCVDLYLWRGVRRINPSAMSVNEVAGRAARLRRVHLLSQLVMVLPAVAFLAVLVSGADEFVRWGVACGATVGVFAGFRIWRRVMRDYRALTEAGRDSFADLEVKE